MKHDSMDTAKHADAMLQTYYKPVVIAAELDDATDGTATKKRGGYIPKKADEDAFYFPRWATIYFPIIL